MKSEPCKACELSRQRQHSGIYKMQCLECCTRLVLSAYPSKTEAAKMLAAIGGFHSSPARQEVLESVRKRIQDKAQSA